MSEIKMPKLDTLKTTCVICGEEFEYLRLKNGKPRRVPKTHKGRCEFIYEKQRLEKKVAKNKRKRNG